MGYTHYLYRPLEIPQEVWDQWVEDCRKILANLPDHSESAGGYHKDDPLCVAWERDEQEKPPQLDRDIIRFNGTTPTKTRFDPRFLDADDLGHETFFVERVFDTSGYVCLDERGRYFQFCKTARKPYDLAVCACLIRMAARMAEGISVSSDGDESEWEPARQLCEDLFGFAAVPFKDSVSVGGRDAGRV